MAKKRLVCDRCGKTLDDKDRIELALEGTQSWHNWVRENRGDEPRGVFPCENFVRCGGEMVIVTGKEKPGGIFG